MYPQRVLSNPRILCQPTRQELATLPGAKSREFLMRNYARAPRPMEFTDYRALVRQVFQPGPRQRSLLVACLVLGTGGAIYGPLARDHYLKIPVPARNMDAYTPSKLGIS